MTEILNRRILLASRPEGKPGPDNFRLVEEIIQGPEESRILVRNRFLSLDPYMRGRMSGVRSYAKPVEVGEVMTGATVGEVLESRHQEFEKRDIVVGRGEWQEHALLKGGEDGNHHGRIHPEGCHRGGPGAGPSCIHRRRPVHDSR